ncbi:hypothetical protein PVAG01_01323 [Phlyctema vagabunda]|uniref:Uncharacterized protein n=1 Tax=Phlyctema vagabunda TaxID=108571 RepID=A0ABR4PWS8_9HELO
MSGTNGSNYQAYLNSIRARNPNPSGNAGNHNAGPPPLLNHPNAPAFSQVIRSEDINSDDDCSDDPDTRPPTTRHGSMHSAAPFPPAPPSYLNMPNFSQGAPPLPNGKCKNAAAVGDGLDSPSSITIQVAVPLNVTGDQNRVSIEPAASASSITNSIVQAVRGLTMTQNGGAPLVGEKGKLRPFKISVDAEVAVQGTGNVVGQKAFDADADTGKAAPENTWAVAARALQKPQVVQPKPQQTTPGQPVKPEPSAPGTAAKRLVINNIQKNMMDANEDGGNDAGARAAPDSNKRPRTE